jgi:hypothetical protein
LEEKPLLGIYDIFQGAPREEAVWLEAIRGVTAAKARMQEIAQINPGRYFILSTENNSIIDSIDNATDGKQRGATAEE